MAGLCRPSDNKFFSAERNGQRRANAAQTACSPETRMWIGVAVLGRRGWRGRGRLARIGLSEGLQGRYGGF